MRVWRLAPTVMAVVLFTIMISSVGLAVNQVSNPGFEEETSGRQVPPGWVMFAGQWGEQLWLESGGVQPDGHALVINTGGVRNAGLRSDPIPAAPGDIYKASVAVFAEPGSRPSLFLDYWDSNRQRIAHASVRTTTTNQWETISTTLEAPEGTEWVSIILYSNASQAPGRTVWDNATLEKDRSLQASVRPDRPDHMYEVGETATFVVSASQGGQPVDRAVVQWRLTLDGVDALSSGTTQVENGEARIMATLDEPGFMRAHVTVIGSGGTVTDAITIGFSPDEIQISRAAPDDFDDF